MSLGNANQALNFQSVVHGRLARAIIAFTFLTACPAKGAITILSNGGFEGTGLAPWYEARASGTTRSWSTSTLRPEEGVKNAFSLGRIELKQDFPEISGSWITEASFFAARRDGGNTILAEWFYGDNTSSGPISFVITESSSSSNTIWHRFDFLPVLDKSKQVIGISFTGVEVINSRGTTHLDNVVIRGIPEPGVIFLTTASALIFFWRRKR